ncbi:hypothetical protein [Mesorhizobium sp. M0843]|uniref:hypothetical protein n=1 Tax=Mesorhizobium sp. M0843 TaxID=2957010 RepID=UPI00333AFCAC
MMFFEGEFDLFDALIGESQDPVVAILALETEGQFLDELFAEAEVPGDKFDGVDDQTAAGWVRSFAGLQFHGSKL